MRSTKKPFRGAKDAEFVDVPAEQEVVMQEPDPQDFLPEPAVEPEPAEPEQPAADEGVAEKLDALIALLSPEQKEQVKAALAGDEDAPEGAEAPEEIRHPQRSGAGQREEYRDSLKKSDFSRGCSLLITAEQSTLQPVPVEAAIQIAGVGVWRGFVSLRRRWENNPGCHQGSSS